MKGIEIAQLIQTLVATVVGGLIVIATNWLSARGKRREAIQEWYERTYITEGIDPLMAYYQSLVFALYSKASDKVISIAKRDIPVEALCKVRVLLLNDVTLSNIILGAHYQLAECTEEQVLQESAHTVQKAVEAFLTFRVELTKAVARQVENKHFLADCTSLIHKLETVEQELKSLVEQPKRQISPKPDMEVEENLKKIEKA